MTVSSTPLSREHSFSTLAVQSVSKQPVFLVFSLLIFYPFISLYQNASLCYCSVSLHVRTDLIGNNFWLARANQRFLSLPLVFLALSPCNSAVLCTSNVSLPHAQLSHFSFYPFIQLCIFNTLLMQHTLKVHPRYTALCTV